MQVSEEVKEYKLQLGNLQESLQGDIAGLRHGLEDLKVRIREQLQITDDAAASMKSTAAEATSGKCDTQQGD